MPTASFQHTHFTRVDRTCAMDTIRGFSLTLSAFNELPGMTSRSHSTGYTRLIGFIVCWISFSPLIAGKIVIDGNVNIKDLFNFKPAASDIFRNFELPNQHGFENSRGIDQFNAPLYYNQAAGRDVMAAFSNVYDKSNLASRHSLTGNDDSLPMGQRSLGADPFDNQFSAHGRHPTLRVPHMHRQNGFGHTTDEDNDRLDTDDHDDTYESENDDYKSPSFHSQRIRNTYDKIRTGFRRQMTSDKGEDPVGFKDMRVKYFSFRPMTSLMKDGTRRYGFVSEMILGNDNRKDHRKDIDLYHIGRGNHGQRKHEISKSGQKHHAFRGDKYRALPSKPRRYVYYRNGPGSTKLKRITNRLKPVIKTVNKKRKLNRRVYVKTGPGKYQSRIFPGYDKRGKPKRQYFNKQPINYHPKRVPFANSRQKRGHDNFPRIIKKIKYAKKNGGRQKSKHGRRPSRYQYRPPTRAHAHRKPKAHFKDLGCAFISRKYLFH